MPFKPTPMIPWLLRSLIVLQAAALTALAHPVAQGAVDLAVRAGVIEVHARVSNEEAFVAAAFGGKADAGTTLNDVWQRHGAYLLAHFQIKADGTPLTGKVTRITPPTTTTPEGRVTYDMTYALPPEQPRPEVIVLRQNMLNEFVFAPGNPWEASYIVSLSVEGRPVQAGRLLASGRPLALGCNWAVPATAPAVDRWTMVHAFARHGIAHILGGYDHLLFVAGLVLAVVSLLDLVKVVTAFTVAHTLTLTLAALDIVRLPERVVEPMIAASIVFVALQNLLAPERSRGWTRLAVAFGFGLFHGLGFAGGLLAAMEGMPGSTIFTAIAAFSIGVEIGHQFVALPLFGALKIMRSATRQARDPERVPRWATRIGSGVIAAAGMVYLAAALR